MNVAVVAFLLTHTHHENVTTENLCIIYEYLILYDRYLNHV